MSTIKTLSAELEKAGISVSSDTIKILFNEGFKSVAILREDPITFAEFKEMNVNGYNAKKLVRHFGATAKKEGGNVDALIAGFAGMMPKQALGEKPWHELLTMLVADPKNQDIMSALMATREIQVATQRTEGNWALVKGSKFQLKATIANLRNLQNRHKTVKRNFSGGLRARNLADALGIVEKYTMHPVTMGETLDGGVDADELIWFGNDDKNWSEDYGKAIFWASGKSGHGRHHLWQNFDAYSVYDGLLYKNRRFMQMVEAYRDAVQHENLTVDMTVKPAKNQHRRVKPSSGGHVQTGDRRIVQVLSEYYTTSELKTMCFNIGIDYEDLGGQGKAGKARELVQFAQRRGRLSEVIIYIQKTRPQISID